MEIAGILISLTLLIYLAYRGFSVIVIAPVLALAAVALSGEGMLMAYFTQVFMAGLAGFVLKYFPLFLLGSLFGKLMEDSGAAKRIAKTIVNFLGAKHAMAAIVLACVVLTYGGVSLFVVVFAIFPIASELFKDAQIPKRLIPGAIGLGAFTFSMTALPGTVQIQNLIPMPYFQTDAFAAPVLGITASIIIFGGGMAWLKYREKSAKLKGEGYGNHPLEQVVDRPAPLPPDWLAFLPIIIIVLSNVLLSKEILPNLDLSYLAESKFGNTNAQSVIGLWTMILSITISIVVLLISQFRYLSDWKLALSKGANASLLPIFNTASEVGYGSVIAALAGFVLIKNYLLALSPENPLISEALSVSVLSGITGSASGGLSIAMEALGEQYMQIAIERGINPELFHRVASLACGGLDSLPHNGAVITLLAICGLSHRQSYKDIGVVTLLIPFSTLLILVLVWGMFI